MIFITLGAPYVAEEVNVSTQVGHILAGTLTIPKEVNQPLSGVVLITGFSPQNRDHSPAQYPEYRFFRLPRIQMLKGQRACRFYNYRALNDIFQLPYIAWPAIGH